ncbi:MAG: hypothetical protein OHK0023_16290 [Anaerolineae bacterium]
MDTPGVFRPSSGVFYLYDDWGGGLPTYTVPFGASVDIPLAGDWDGDGKDTPGVFRSTTGFFYLQDLEAPDGFIWIELGTSTDIPLTGDWNANGIDSPGVFQIEQEQYGIFHLSNRESNGGGVLPDLSVVFGTGGDVPY